jgi:integrase/recombinase XerD
MGIVSQSAAKSVAKGKIVADDPQGLLYLTARYMEALRVRNFTEQTVYGRGKMLRYFRVYCEQIGVTQARQVTRAVMINYQSYLYHYRKEDGKALTIGTQKAWLSCVTAFFSWLTREGLALYNPASDLELPRREVRLPKIILNASEVEAILSVPDLSTPMGIRDRAILETLYSTGIRRQELCNLRLGDLDYDRGLVRIEQGKGHKDRYVPIGNRAVQWIEKYLLEVRPRLCPSLNEQAIFLNTLGTRMNANRLGSQVHGIIRSAGIGKSGSCHLFRHTFATLLLENGCDVRYVQEMLGHSKMETTAVYTHVAIKTLKEVHSRFHPARLPQADTAAR